MIIDIIKDIFTDASVYESKAEAAHRESGSFRRYRRGGGLLMIFLPQLIGFVLGTMAAVFLGADLTGGVVIGVFIALAAGTVKSVTADQISLVPAIIRNIIIMLMIVVLGIICLLINKVTDK